MTSGENETVAQGDGRRGGTGRRVQLAPNLGHVVGNGSTTDAERGGNLFVRLAVDQQLQDFALPQRETEPGPSRGRRCDSCARSHVRLSPLGFLQNEYVS